MSDNQIIFRIGSTFSGEGFTKARQTVSEMNNSVKRGVSSATQLAGAMGEMDASSAKAMGAMTGLLQAFMTLNATAIITQGAMMAISWYLGGLKDKAEQAKQKADALKESVRGAFDSALRDSISSVSDDIKTISTEFETVTAQANAFTAALNGLSGSVATGGIVNLEIEKLNAMLESQSDAARQAVEATYNLKIAVQKAADVEMAGAQKIEAAHQAVVDNQNKVAMMDDQIAVIAKKRAELEQVMLAAKASDDENWRKLQKAIEDLQKQEAEIIAKQNAAREATATLELKEQQVKQDAINANASATLAVKQAELADQKLTDAKHNRELKERAAAEKAELEKVAALRDIAEKEEAAKIQKKTNDATKRLNEAISEYEEALRDYEARLAQIKVSGVNVQAGSLSSADIANAIKQGLDETVAHRVAQGLREGRIRTLQDWLQAENAAKAEFRTAQTSRQSANEKRDAQYKAWLEKQSKQVLSERQKQDLERLKKIDEAKKEADERFIKAKKELDAAKKEASEQAKNVKAIKDKLDRLGLK